MLNYRVMWMALLSAVIMISLSGCGNALRGDPVLPQEVVDAIAKESVKFFSEDAPEGSKLVETAKLETFWGNIVESEAEKYSDVICFKAEIQYNYNGLPLVTYYQGIVKKPNAKGIPWFIDKASFEMWDEYSCTGDFLRRQTPTPIGEE